MTIPEKIKLRKIIEKICLGDLPNKPDGNNIENMTERYLAYHRWHIEEGYNLIEEFIEELK